MNHNSHIEGLDLAALFAAGAMKSAAESGMSGAYADEVCLDACKMAASSAADLPYDDEDDTWWSRNKGWLVPAVATAVAFHLGGNAGRYGRRDRYYLSNLWDSLKTTARQLSGLPVDDPLYTAAVRSHLSSDKPPKRDS